MKKTIVVLIVILVAGGVVVFMLSKPKQPTNQQTNTLQVTPLPTPTIPAGDKISLNTQLGSIMVNNFFQNSRIIETSVYLADEKTFSIIYFSVQKEFLINLNVRDFQSFDSVRGVAENKFLSLLGINETDACKLKVQLSVPISYSEELSQNNYDLSFCNQNNIGNIIR